MAVKKVNVSSGVALRTRAVVAVAICGSVIAACGGDDAAEVVTTTTEASVETTAAPAETTTTVEETTTTAVPEIVTVANASSINGSAGRMSELLAAEGFDMGTPTNSTEGALGASKIYYIDDEAALAVAESLVRAFGGVIQLVEMPAVPPISSSELGDAGVIVSLGDDFADQLLPGVAT
ncbi:MAG: LytR C-terminal domain-containing protein, partial [Acidimicrobiaceae bacterium]